MKTIPNIIPVYGTQDVNALDMTEGELAVTTASGYPVIVGGFTDTNGDIIKVPLTAGAAETIGAKPTINIPFEGTTIDNSTPLSVDITGNLTTVKNLVYQVSFDVNFSSIMLAGRFHVVHGYATEANEFEWNVDALLSDLRKIVHRYDEDWMETGGTLYFRVATIDDNDVISPYSDARSVSISAEASSVTPITVGAPEAGRHSETNSATFYDQSLFFSKEGLTPSGKYFDSPIIHVGGPVVTPINQVQAGSYALHKPNVYTYMAPTVDAAAIRAADAAQGNNDLYGVEAGLIALKDTSTWIFRDRLGGNLSFVFDIGTHGVALNPVSVSLSTTGTEPSVVNTTTQTFDVFYADADSKIVHSTFTVVRDDVVGLISASVTNTEEYDVVRGGNVLLEPGERILASGRIKSGFSNTPTIITNRHIFADNRYPTAFFTYNEDDLPVSYIKVDSGAKAAIVQFDVPGHGARVIKLQSNDVPVRVADYWIGERTSSGYTDDYEVVDSIIYDHSVEDHNTSTLFLIARPKGSVDFLSNELRAARFDPAYGFVDVTSAAFPEKPVVLSRSINQSLTTDYVKPTVLYASNEQSTEFGPSYNLAVATLE